MCILFIYFPNEILAVFFNYFVINFPFNFLIFENTLSFMNKSETYQAYFKSSVTEEI
jgi:hypothetical protein